MFIILCIQLAMGAYLNGLDPSALEQRWHEATPTTRDAIQKFLTCCGWSGVADTTPFPDCNYAGWRPPTTTCKDAAYAYINKNIRPVAVAAITLASVEFVSMFATCGLIYTAKELKP